MSSKFGKKYEESTTKKAKNTYTSDYLKIVEGRTTVIRVLEPEPEMVWSHWIPKGHNAFPTANAGKGISFVCPGYNECPVCAWNREQEDKEKKLNARRVFTFNVLDRTPVITCPGCELEHYENKGVYPSTCECGVSLVDVEPEARDKNQLMQKGVTFIKALVTLEEDKDNGDLMTYDIKINVRGSGTEAVINCIPKPASELDLEEIIGENWQEKIYDVKALMSPLPVDSIKRILNGEDYYTVIGAK